MLLSAGCIGTLLFQKKPGIAMRQELRPKKAAFGNDGNRQTLQLYLYYSCSMQFTFRKLKPAIISDIWNDVE